MDINDINQAQANSILQFMENNGIKKDVLRFLVNADMGLGQHQVVSPKGNPQNPYRIQQAQHKARVIKLYLEGYSQVNIARLTGRTQSGISCLLQRARDNGEIAKRSFDARHAV
jgi:hypothetical protein